MQQLTPYIIFKGNCEAALKFYEKALGGEIGQVMRYAHAPGNQMGMDPDKIMHAHLNLNGNFLLMASDGRSDAKD